MKKLSRRLVSIFMAAIMICSFSTVAYATGESNSTAISQEIVTTDATSAISPREIRALTDIIQLTNITTGQIETGNFFQSPPAGSYITIVIRGNASCTVAVNGKTKYIPSGGGVYSICTAGDRNSGYTIRFHENANAAVFQFTSSDFRHDGE